MILTQIDKTIFYTYNRFFYYGHEVDYEEIFAVGYYQHDKEEVFILKYIFVDITNHKFCFAYNDIEDV